jgi:hypothetical protein
VSDTLYAEVVSITEQYLGPAAPRFITRQIAFHLGKDPHQLNHQDIPKLVEWTRVTLAMLTEDKDIVEEYACRVSALGD